VLGEAIILHIVESATFHVIRHNYHRFRLLRCAVFSRSEDIRVAFCAMLLLRDGDRYLLIRNLHRRESFGPFGGVFKYKDISKLDDLEFKPQTQPYANDMKEDIRGFLPRKRLPSLIAWFKKGWGRESSEECLTREMREEMAEAELPRRLNFPESLRIKHVRTVEELPARVPGQLYTQYRIFEVHELNLAFSSMKKFNSQLFSVVPRHRNNLLLATAKEIEVGRAESGELIGHHACYLIGKKRLRPESPMFSTQAGEGSR
jgi:hypothetical protein